MTFKEFPQEVFLPPHTTPYNNSKYTELLLILEIPVEATGLTPLKQEVGSQICFSFKGGNHEPELDFPFVVFRNSGDNVYIGIKT